LGDKCCTIAIAAGKSAGKGDSTRVNASNPWAEAASATTKKPEEAEFSPDADASLLVISCFCLLTLLQSDAAVMLTRSLEFGRFGILFSGSTTIA
jgi:hypothetical protein